MIDLLARLPRLPISSDLAILLSVLVVSIAAGLVALIRNRRQLRDQDDQATDLGVIFENPGSIMPHIIELRQRIIYSLVGILVGTSIAGALTQEVLVLLAEPIGGLEHLLLYRVTEGVGVFVRIAVTLGIILSSPFVISQIWIFVGAGLKANERRTFYILMPFAVLLFLAGVAFAYFVMLPVAVPFLTTFLAIRSTPVLEDYIAFVANAMLWVGISFEMPLILFGLAKLKIVNAGMLARNWRIAVVIIAIVAAVVTPTPDPVNMAIVAAPLLIRFILSIVLTLFA